MAQLTIEEKTHAISLGYEIELGEYEHLKGLTKEPRHVWPIRDGFQTADLINGSYTNHKIMPDLISALDRK